LKDEANKDAHLLVYTAVVYLTLFPIYSTAWGLCYFFISS